MPRPADKAQLLHLSQQTFDDLNACIDAMPESERLATFPEGTMNRNIRDVLAHLHAWHLMLLDWYNTGMKGQKPVMPAQGYTWKDTPALNRKIWEEAAQISLPDIRTKLEQSHKAIRLLMEQHSNEELFEKKRYRWTGSTSLGQYLVSATSSHYEWAIRLIKKQLKSFIN